ncbi:PEP-CTERM sorting domain-containing protein [Microseira wollei]|uniref:Ice-binding protein C-terminal domain-containing protein n=1 Tax=Microseira wollei NIES-4236 TaxID=2530354 RepID=A0AAV3XID2_9CYAN|nr:PEP-CTERM sorting domain-containing protein [Microseira wollei]GET40259.1 hypothetical protein MiSe_50680 [Microseira wollei NIES-4236]
MANSIYQKLALATAGTVLSLAVMETASVQAATITYDFTVNLTNGDFKGNSYTGFFSYNDSEPSGVSELLYPYFAPSDFSFEFLGKTYTESDLRYSVRSIMVPPLSYLTFTNPRVVTDNRPYFVPGGELDQVKFLVTDYNSAGIGSYIINLYENKKFFFWFFDQFPQNTISQGGGTWKYKLREQLPSTSVPEPGTVFGLSMLGFGWLLRKKKASSHA